jgi:hypothetical protein
MSQFFVGVSAGSLPPSVPTTFHTDDGANVIPLSNVLNVAGGIGATTTGNVGTGTVTINVKNDGFAWVEENGDFTAEVQKGYFCNVALTGTLPSTLGPPALVLGNTIIFYVDVSLTLPSVVTVKAPADQRIEVGGQISILGGTATANVQGSMLGLVFKLSDLTWHAVESMGSWTVV